MAVWIFSALYFWFRSAEGVRVANHARWTSAIRNVHVNASKKIVRLHLGILDASIEDPWLYHWRSLILPSRIHDCIIEDSLFYHWCPRFDQWGSLIWPSRILDLTIEDPWFNHRGSLIRQSGILDSAIKDPWFDHRGSLLWPSRIPDSTVEDPWLYHQQSFSLPWMIPSLPLMILSLYVSRILVSNNKDCSTNLQGMFKLLSTIVFIVPSVIFSIEDRWSHHKRIVILQSRILQAVIKDPVLMLPSYSWIFIIWWVNEV